EYMLERDQSVSPTCLVVWRPAGPPRNGGHQLYSGLSREENAPVFPTISRGLDVRALVEAMMPYMQRQMMKNLERMERGESMLDLDMEQVNAELAELPEKPDEHLE
ncbi:MAG TPA: hypothetical protein VJ982_13740, partial [Gemmatimonadota bacterium]|nr:hypothetical protein [Gemmatimonadota bacterium]